MLSPQCLTIVIVLQPQSDDTFETKVSALQAQLKFGDACTFRLIAKNVTNLLPNSDTELKQATNDSLKELLNAFQLLDDMVSHLLRSPPPPPLPSADLLSHAGRYDRQGEAAMTDKEKYRRSTMLHV